MDIVTRNTIIKLKLPLLLEHVHIKIASSAQKAMQFFHCIGACSKVQCHCSLIEIARFFSRWGKSASNKSNYFIASYWKKQLIWQLFHCNILVFSINCKIYWKLPISTYSLPICPTLAGTQFLLCNLNLFTISLICRGISKGLTPTGVLCQIFNVKN